MKASQIGLASVIVLGGFSILGIIFSLWKLLIIVWTAFAAMAVAIPLGSSNALEQNPTQLVWGYGLSSGAMLTSASVFLVPSAISYHASFGGFGIAAGIFLGFALHTIGHWLSHCGISFDPITTELTTHSLSAGLIIGMVYSIMPGLGIMLGLAIISHKGPAGFAASRRLTRNNHPTISLLLPASAVGIAALPMGLFNISVPDTVQGMVFGLATGVFIHLAMDFLPKCEIGGEVYSLTNASEKEHHLLDKLRVHAVASTVAGGGIIFVLWLIFQ